MYHTSYIRYCKIATISHFKGVIDNTKEAEDVRQVLNVTEGSHITIYHESSKNVTFCAVKPPFFPGSLRAGFGNDQADWEVDTGKVSR